jgi:hypothetical protein
MSQRETQCSIHGREGIGLVCEHIAYGMDERKRVGF